MARKDPEVRIPLSEQQALALEHRAARSGQGVAEQRHGPTGSQGHGAMTSRPHDVGVGSWANPRVRADGVRTRATTVHLPIELAMRLDELRIRSRRRLSDLLVEAASSYWMGRGR